MSEPKPFQMPTLGRPFQLGMLYDERSDSLITGITLWNHEDMQKTKQSRPKPNTKYSIILQDDTQSKTSALDIKGELKLSILSGLIKAEGSGKYLYDNKSSSQNARVTLNYSCTTIFEQLDTKQLTREDTSGVYDNKSATHVVVGIVYGANAFFVFDRNVSMDEQHNDVKAEVEAIVKKIPQVDAEVKGDAKYKSDDVTKEELLSCTFHGDFILERNPSTFEEAAKIYREIPSLLGLNYKFAVPVEVYLHPIHLLNTREAILVQSIQQEVIDDIENVCEDLSKLKYKCNDLKQHPISCDFPEIHEKLSTFSRHLQRHTTRFKENVMNLLCKIRGCHQETTELNKLLLNSGPFNIKDLDGWCRGVQKEITILDAYKKQLTGATFAHDDGELESEIISHSCLVCLTFNLNTSSDAYLEKLSAFLSKIEPSTTQNMFVWYNANTKREINKTIRNFVEYIKKIQVRFVVASDQNPDKPCGVSITVFKDGDEVSDGKEIPSQIQEGLLGIPGGTELNILLIGQAGEGKSSTGNLILSAFEERKKAPKRFHAHGGGLTCNSTVVKESNVVDGRMINLVEMPADDLFKDETEYLNEVSKAFEMCADGYDAFILVLRYGHLLSGDSNTFLKKMEMLFGEKFKECTIVAMTGGDTFVHELEKTFDKYEQIVTELEKYANTPRNGAVLRKYLGGCVLINNFEDDEIKKRHQIISLVEKVDVIKAKQKNNRYTKCGFDRTKHNFRK